MPVWLWLPLVVLAAVGLLFAWLQWWLPYARSEARRWAMAVRESAARNDLERARAMHAIPQAETALAARLENAATEARRKVLAAMPIETLDAYPGIGPASVAKLRSAGYPHVAALLGARLDIPGFGEKRSADVNAALRQIIEDTKARFAARASPEAVEFAAHCDRLRAETAREVDAARAVVAESDRISAEFAPLLVAAGRVSLFAWLRAEGAPLVPPELMARPIPDVDARLRRAGTAAAQVPTAPTPHGPAPTPPRTATPPAIPMPDLASLGQRPASPPALTTPPVPAAPAAPPPRSVAEPAPRLPAARAEPSDLFRRELVRAAAPAASAPPASSAPTAEPAKPPKSSRGKARGPVAPEPPPAPPALSDIEARTLEIEFATALLRTTGVKPLPGLTRLQHELKARHADKASLRSRSRMLLASLETKGPPLDEVSARLAARPVDERIALTALGLATAVAPATTRDAGVKERLRATVADVCRRLDVPPPATDDDRTAASDDGRESGTFDRPAPVTAATPSAPAPAAPPPPEQPAGLRHNPDLDSFFDGPAEPPPAPSHPAADSAPVDMRHNPDLDSAFGM